MEVWLGLLYGVPADQLVGVARAAEELGFHGIALPDHVAVPVDFVTEGPPGHDEFKAYIGATGYWLDPLISIAAMAPPQRGSAFSRSPSVLPIAIQPWWRSQSQLPRSSSTTAWTSESQSDG